LIIQKILRATTARTSSATTRTSSVAEKHVSKDPSSVLVPFGCAQGATCGCSRTLWDAWNTACENSQSLWNARNTSWKYACSFFFLFTFLLIPTITQAQSRKELEDRRRTLIKEIGKTNALLEDTRSSRKNTINQYFTLQKQIEKMSKN